MDDSGYYAAPQPLTAAQAKADTIAKESSTAKDSLSNAGTEAQTKSPTPRSETDVESASTVSSVKDKSPLLLFIVFIFIIAALGIFGLCVAASARKRSAH